MFVLAVLPGCSSRVSEVDSTFLQVPAESPGLQAGYAKSLIHSVVVLLFHRKCSQTQDHDRPELQPVVQLLSILVVVSLVHHLEVKVLPCRVVRMPIQCPTDAQTASIYIAS